MIAVVPNLGFVSSTFTAVICCIISAGKKRKAQNASKCQMMKIHD